MTLEQRTKQLRKMLPQITQKILDAAKNATIRAVEKAAEETPPVGNDLKGTNTRSGEMKQHWSTDSKIDPQISGNAIQTELANNMQYASYVNDGHRLDRHFVPGLYINPCSGLLEYDAAKDVGIVVGTKTAYVSGLFMADKAKEVYQKTVRTELAGLEDMLK